MVENCLIISTHDFRSRRKANIHFIANELSRRAKVRFFSVGFSYLSYISGDARLSAGIKANRVERIRSVECFLWRTALHPVRMRTAMLRSLEYSLFRLSSKRIPTQLGIWSGEADTILIESGLPVIYFDKLQELNPNARFIYIASDELRAIGCSEYLVDELRATFAKYDLIRLASRAMASNFPDGSRLRYVPHGIDPEIANYGDPCPYTGGVNAVCVGSTMFDKDCISIAAQKFPSMTFHIIGAGHAAVGLGGRDNIRIYREMPFLDTIPFIKHADIGLAPYSEGSVSPYLADTSMKLIQYAFFGVPSVCPDIVAAQHVGRFGYRPGDTGSIQKAIESALDCGHIRSQGALPWSEVVDRILQPPNDDDTIMDMSVPST